MTQSGTTSVLQQGALVALRIAIGWHLLYDAWMKLWDAGYTSAGFLAASRGPVAPLFRELAAHGRLLSVLERFTGVALSAVGLGLVLGLATRTSARIAAAFLVVFYLVNPPLPGVDFLPGEGTYLLINKTLVEVLALATVSLFPTGEWVGLDRLLDRRRHVVTTVATAATAATAATTPAASAELPAASDESGRWS